MAPRNFVFSEAAEITQLDDAALPLVEVSKLGQCLIQQEEIAPAGVDAREVVVEHDPQRSVRTFRRRAGAGMVHENAAHHSRRQREEMHAALPVDLSLAQQAQIGFVHQRGRLECVALAVTTKMACGALPELAVDERQQLLLRVLDSQPTTPGADVSPLPLTPIACLRAPSVRARDTTEPNLPR